ncbi:zinc finger BED domain-containing protein RICESLEEPER 1-like [Argentina anserina]|uniref:zinc finger BED domain-containing protein RICESLEEPER 1-like n=1 Tax=Argentina anserina TaxID=57926 RepID=UPI002176667F|nr:zinc finger BED domain-containing protein RICESLEEPER 1-like [Potentilla anserina]
MFQVQGYGYTIITEITANLLFIEMITLQTEIDMDVLSEDDVLRRVAASMKTKFNEYWGSFESINKIIMISNVDPRYKLQWAHVGLKKVNASYATIQTIEENLKRILMRMYEEYKRDVGADQAEQSANEDVGLEGDELERLDEISREIARERMSAQSQCIRNKVDQYFFG